MSGLLPQPAPDRLQPPAMLGDPIQQGTMTWLLQPLELHSGKSSRFVMREPTAKSQSLVVWKLILFFIFIIGYSGFAEVTEVCGSFSNTFEIDSNYPNSSRN